MSDADRELEAARALQDHLNQAGFPASFVASAPGDFPDFTFTVEVDGKPERWAVEETSLWREVELNQAAVSDEVIFRALDEMLLGIKAGFPTNLGAGYLFGAFGPLSTRARRRIERQVIEYVESGRAHMEMYDAEGQVTADPFKKWAGIHQIDKPGHFVPLTGLHASVMAGDRKSLHIDLRPLIEFTLKRRVQAKLLRFASGLADDRKVLVLTKKFVHVEAGEVGQILAGMALTGDQVDAILLVTLDDDHFFYPGDGTVHFTPISSAHLVASPGKWISYSPSFDAWRPQIRPLG